MRKKPVSFDEDLEFSFGHDHEFVNIRMLMGHELLGSIINVCNVQDFEALSHKPQSMGKATRNANKNG